jgi:hypothetical protein
MGDYHFIVCGHKIEKKTLGDPLLPLPHIPKNLDHEPRK